AQGCTKEAEVSILSSSISFEFSTHAGSAAETEEHDDEYVFEALWEVFLGCVVACTSWLVKRRLLRCSLWGLFTGNSTLLSLARSVFFFSTFIEGDNCLEEVTREGEDTAE
ncbi:hypothetical protein N307_12318, partial [Dryobates pubescens]